MPKSWSESAGSCILRPRVFCSSGIGQVSRILHTMPRINPWDIVQTTPHISNTLGHFPHTTTNLKHTGTSSTQYHKSQTHWHIFNTTTHITNALGHFLHTTTNHKHNGTSSTQQHISQTHWDILRPFCQNCGKAQLRFRNEKNRLKIQQKMFRSQHKLSIQLDSV